MPKRVQKQAVRKLRSAAVKPAAKKPSKPVKLSKSDPDYFAKIGAISAAKRKISSEQFSAMAKKSHYPGRVYAGGRPKGTAKK